MNKSKINRSYRNEGISSKDSFWMVKKSIVRFLGLGLEGGGYLAELIEYANYLCKAKLIRKESDWFFYRQVCPKDENGEKDYSKRSIEASTGITKTSQDTYMKKLIEVGFLEVKKEGIPRRMFYKINFDKINKFEYELGEEYTNKIMYPEDDFYSKNRDSAVIY